MIAPRSLVLLALTGLPILIYIVAGGVALWSSGSFRWIWWLVPACGLAAVVLSRVWKATPVAQQIRHHLPSSSHWTPRDQRAAEQVRAYQEAVESHSPDELADPHFYVRQLQSLAMDLARVYHPSSSDPLERLTVPEVLAALRLAIDDIEPWMLESVPGSRMFTIRHWRMLPSAPRWAQRLSQATWAAAVLLNPINITRYAVSRWTWGPVTDHVRSELLAILYLRFIRQAGFYLIEMNSGRLRGGADAYRAGVGAGPAPRPVPVLPPEGESVGPQEITVALVGQVSAGKSSLINLLVAGADAKVDVLPETREVQRYRCVMGDPPLSLTLFDTPGYGEGGAPADQLRRIHRSLADADAVVLVMDAHSPARQADHETYQRLQAVYAGQPQLKPPSVIGVLTHVDLLPPPLKWSPPYQWRAANRAKSGAMFGAVRHVTELFDPPLSAVVPVCSDNRPARAWGVTEELIPALVGVLDDARSVALLRAYEGRLDRHRYRTLLNQVAQAGEGLVRAWLETRLADVESRSVHPRDRDS